MFRFIAVLPNIIDIGKKEKRKKERRLNRKRLQRKIHNTKKKIHHDSLLRNQTHNQTKFVII